MLRRFVLAAFLTLACAPALAQDSSSGTQTATGTATAQLILVCGPAASGASASTACPADMNGNPQTPVVLQGYVMTSADYSALQAAIAPFDYTFAGSCFGAGVGLILTSYFLALPLGTMARMLGSA